MLSHCIRMTKIDIYFNRFTSPYLQAASLLALSAVIMLVAKLVEWSQLLKVNPNFPWLSAASFMLMFAIFNSISSIAAKDGGKYWSQSIMSFMGLAAGAGFFAYLFSSRSIWEAGSYSWIYIVLAFGYLVFLGIIGMMKNIVEFAQREEWTQPRIRHKNDQKRSK